MSTSCATSCGTEASEAFDADDVATLCKALGHPARVLLLKHLADHGECYFGNLADVLPLSPSTISKHVSILKDAGLICGSADAQRVCYCVNTARLAHLKRVIGTL